MAFKIPFKNSPSDLITKIQKAVNENNGVFSGDENQGDIEISSPIGKISAAYKIVNQEIDIQIVEKPFFISEEIIKSEILKMLA